jgi:predicted metal-binding membrane protein
MTGRSLSATDSTRASLIRLASGLFTQATRVLNRDKLIVAASIVALTGMCWANLMSTAGGVHSHRMAQPYVFAAATWMVMMIGMMAPSALPFLTTFAVMARRRRGGNPLLLTSMFLLGYLFMWTGFSAIAAAVQLAFHAASLLSHTSESLSPAAGGALLIAAGTFQWMPAKDACLRNCRAPLGFLISEWRDGAGGACRMGLIHGAFCVGCCWLLMLLPFAAGVMNLGWMLAITIYVLLEKALPVSDMLVRAGGAVLAGYGAWTIWSAYN